MGLTLKLKKVHEVLELSQSCLNPYMNLNTSLRKQTKNEWKHFYTLMNNAVSGKSMENVWKHNEVQLVTKREVYRA